MRELEERKMNKVEKDKKEFIKYLKKNNYSQKEIDQMIIFHSIIFELKNNTIN
jgi:hypothetical protein